MLLMFALLLCDFYIAALNFLMGPEEMAAAATAMPLVTARMRLRKISAAQKVGYSPQPQLCYRGLSDRPCSPMRQQDCVQPLTLSLKRPTNGARPMHVFNNRCSTTLRRSALPGPNSARSSTVARNLSCAAMRQSRSGAAAEAALNSAQAPENHSPQTPRQECTVSCWKITPGSRPGDCWLLLLSQSCATAAVTALLLSPLSVASTKLV